MKTEIIAILDNSWSMATIGREAADGFNQFVQDQRKLPGEARLTLITFNSSSQVHYRSRDLHSVPMMTSYPTRGRTALNDAIGDALASPPAGADQTIVVILTDGEENSSYRFNKDMVRSLIEQRQRDGWQFIFLAANQDAFAAAGNYGIPREFTAGFAYDKQGMTQAMAYVSQSTTQIRGTTY